MMEAHEYLYPVTMEDTRLAGLAKSLGTPLVEKIQNSRVLMVGAGGIGCELLKNLVLSGFQDIEIIDLDTIDTSNLNRQFLFQKQHVGKSKSECARDAAMKWNPDAKMKAHHDDVKRVEFGPSFVKDFDIVLNALDNLSARRHVNRVCLAADVPLIESGSAGYLGQVQVIKKSVSECFECTPTAPPKSFPICTIRSNPSTPIHCIVWAQHVFKGNFGPIDEDTEGEGNDEKEGEEEEKDKDSEEEKNKKDTLPDEIQKEREERQRRLKEDKAVLEREREKSFERWLFHKLFHTEVLYLSTLTHLWVDRKPPAPLFLKDDVNELKEGIDVQRVPVQNTLALIPDQRVWSLDESIAVFLRSAAKLSQDALISRDKWDKDNATHLDFVTATANIRAAIFHLEFSSRFFVKEKAGNIIPAIATTNAVVAGLIVMKAFRVLAGKIKECRNTWLKKQPTRGMLFVGSKLDAPNPECYVCGKHNITLKIDTKETVKYFIEEVVKKEWNMSSPVITTAVTVLYDECDNDSEDDEFRKQLFAKKLQEFHMSQGAIIYVEDNIVQNLKITVSIEHSDQFKETDEKRYEVVGGIPEAISATTTEVPVPEPKVADDGDDDIIMEVQAPSETERGHKRKRVDEEEATEVFKKQKTGQ